MVLWRVVTFPSLRTTVRVHAGRGGVFLLPFLRPSSASFLLPGVRLGGCGGSVGFKLFSVWLGLWIVFDCCLIFMASVVVGLFLLVCGDLFLPCVSVSFYCALVRVALMAAAARVKGARCRRRSPPRRRPRRSSCSFWRVYYRFHCLEWESNVINGLSLWFLAVRFVRWRYGLSVGCAGVRLCVLNLISGVRVRSRVGGQICFNCWIACVRICVLNSVSACACARGSADRSFQLFDRGRSICSRRARVRSRVSGQTCFLFSRFFITCV